MDKNKRGFFVDGNFGLKQIIEGAVFTAALCIAEAFLYKKSLISQNHFKEQLIIFVGLFILYLAINILKKKAEKKENRH